MHRSLFWNGFGAWTTERPVFLMGDFNCRPGSTPYRALVDENDPGNPDLFKNPYVDPMEIDWILYKGPVKVLKYEEVDYNVDGKYPSDHKPIYVEFELK